MHKQVDPDGCPISLGAAESPLLSITAFEQDGLPLFDLIELALREGRRPRPIYQMHKWFARRLPSVFRATLVAATLPPGGDFWKAYYGPPGMNEWTVLDPFVGGGTSVVEAQRLGATVIGCDIDPIACAISRAELSAAAMPDLASACETLASTVGAKMAQYYKIDPHKGVELTALHYFWVQIVSCGKCHQDFEAHHSYVFAETEGGRWTACKACGDIRLCMHQAHAHTCAICGTTQLNDDGNVRNGRATCPHCEHESKLIDLSRAAGSQPRWKLSAVEAYPTHAKRHPVPNKERVFLRPTDTILNTYLSAERELARLLEEGTLELPDQEIDERDRSDKRLTAYGYRRWKDLFNSRQKLHLVLLMKEIKTSDASVRPFLALAFSNHLPSNCMLTSYTSIWRRLTPLFSIRGFRHVTRPVELNPWTSGTGRGSFPNAIRQLSRAAESARSPREPLVSGGFVQVTDTAPNVAAKILNGSASEMSDVASNSVDVVLSDPPYFDNVAYSELSEFFQPWLREFGVTSSDSERAGLVARSIVSKKRNGSGSRDFSEQLGKAFGEIERVLKPNGLLAFTYRHSTAEAWQALFNALSAAQLAPITVMPVPGEIGSGLHAHPGTCLWDAMLVFRKRARSECTGFITSRSKRDVDKATADWMCRLSHQSKLPFTYGDAVNLWRATLCSRALGDPSSQAHDESVKLDCLLKSPPKFGEQENYAGIPQEDSF